MCVLLIAERVWIGSLCASSTWCLCRVYITCMWSMLFVLARVYEVCAESVQSCFFHLLNILRWIVFVLRWSISHLSCWEWRYYTPFEQLYWWVPMGFITANCPLQNALVYHSQTHRCTQSPTKRINTRSVRLLYSNQLGVTPSYSKPINDVQYRH